MAIKDQETGYPMYGPFPEQTSIKYKASIVDEDNEIVTSLDAVSVTIFEKKSGIILNDRKQQNILNVSGGSFSNTDGVFTLQLDPDDNKMISKRENFEDHVVRFDYIYNGTKTGRHAIMIRLLNLNVGVV